jgi:polysaccharide export outer membrane protein
MHTSNTIARLFAIIFVASVLCACNTHIPIKHSEEWELTATTFKADSKHYPSQIGLFPNYKLVPGDVLDVLFQIRTWQNKENFVLAVDHTVTIKFVHTPELNETQNIQPDGNISLPYLGEIRASGLTVDELTTRLKKRYATILRDPEIYIIVPEYRSRIKELKKDLHTASRGLSRLVTVRPDGYCTFPLAGDIFVADRTIPQINEELDNIYQSYLPGLHVDLFLEKHSGALVYVMGQVKQSGSFSIAKPITVSQALALAGGHLNEADLKRLLVFRRHEERFGARRIDLTKTLQLKDGGSMFYLRPDDIVYVPRLGRAHWAEVMRQVKEIILFQGWSTGLDGPLFEKPLLR